MGLTLELINFYFRYDKNQGKLFWKNHTSPQVRARFVGKEAGSNKVSHNKTYRRIHFYNKNYYSHVIIYFIETGVWDSKIHIDHVDGNSLNNHITNLRATTLRQNHQNRDRHINGDKMVGTHLRKDTGRWSAKIYINGKEKYLGCYDTEEEAHLVYCNALDEYKIERLFK